MADTFTPEQIAQILEEFFKTVGTRQYIGARYVPLFGRKYEESIEWDNSKPYEPLTVVLYQGNSFTSRQYVPAGVEITNEAFWAETGNFNAQIEQYRREVAQLREDYTQYKENLTESIENWETETTTSLSNWKTNTTTELDTWKDETESAFTAAIDNIPAILPSSAFTPQKTVRSYIDNMALSLRKGVMVVLGDSWSDEQNDPATSWISTVSRTLGMTAYVTNAKAGNGFAFGDTPIPNQIAGAVDKVVAAGYTAEDVTLVIAFGGVNDYRRGMIYAAVADGIRNTFTRSRTAFPNAKIQIICGNTGNWSTMDALDGGTEGRRASYADYPEWLTNIKNNIRNNAWLGDAYCDDVALWLNMYGSNAWSNIWNSDTLHPLQTGANIIAHRIIEVLNGNTGETYYCTRVLKATPNSNPTIETVPLDVSYSLHGRHVSIAFHINTASPVTGLPDTLYWDISTLLPVICAGSNAYNYRIPVNAWNYGPDYVTAMRGYYNAATNRLTLYPSSTQGNLSQMFGSVEFDLM